MAGQDPPEHPDLLDRIRAEIREGGPIPFRSFMERALLDPSGGYYSRGEGRLGKGGDFFTASDAGTVFGECVAEQLREMDALLARPRPFSIVEYGAGRGLLARDIVDALGKEGPGLAERMSLVLVDESEGMRALAATRVPEARVVPPGLEGEGHVGCILAVELFDALPVHRLKRTQGRLMEVHVGLDPRGQLVECDGEPSPEAVSLATRYGAAPDEGFEAEVCPLASAVIERMHRVLARGFLVVVDYGYPAAELYGPAHRRGTLLAYHRHTVSEQYLERVGEQDLTAHVNFTQIEDRARELGMDVLGLTTQDRFLVANGILRHFEEPAEGPWSGAAATRRRLNAMQLIHPEGMGRTFKVLMLAKGLSGRPALQGLRDPFAREVRG